MPSSISKALSLGRKGEFRIRAPLSERLTRWPGNGVHRSLAALSCCRQATPPVSVLPKISIGDWPSPSLNARAALAGKGPPEEKTVTSFGLIESNDSSSGSRVSCAGLEIKALLPKKVSRSSRRSGRTQVTASKIRPLASGQSSRKSRP